MTKHWTPLALIWLALAIAGLVLSTVFNALSVVQARNFFADWVGSGAAVTSLTVDLLVVAVAGSILVVVEARRVGMRFAWLYLVVSGVTAFAFGFPLFLAMRERRLTAARSAAQKRELDV
jgi:hypothetical protein